MRSSFCYYLGYSPMCDDIYIITQSVLVMKYVEGKRFYMCLATLFAGFWINGGAKISMKSSFMEMHSAVVKCQAKILLFRVNCWLLNLLVSREKRERCEKRCRCERNTLWYRPRQIFWNSAQFTVVREWSKLTFIFSSSEVALTCCFVYRSHYHLAILCSIITTIINARRSMSSLVWHSLADWSCEHHNGVKMAGNVNFV